MSDRCQDCTFLSEENRRYKNILFQMYLALDPYCTGLDYNWMIQRVKDLMEQEKG